MRADPIGLYVHIPICISKCNYCDFCSFPKDSFDVALYIEKLCSEIDHYGGQGIAVNTIFFGGGTPSLLSGDQFKRIVYHIKKTFKVSEETEFTIEANPKTLTRENLMEYIASGVNRVSLGLQSIHENELKILGRIHDFDDFVETYNLVRECGISNVNVDLMYGIPNQTQSSFIRTLQNVIVLSPEHLSVYGLILEEGTRFWQLKDTLHLPSEDEECDMYFAASSMLRDNGYSHYEISNYSKPGFECAHNLKYWRAKEYIGFGVAAHSYFAGKRFGNSVTPSEYFNGNNITSECIDRAASAYEYVMLSLRLSEGFSLTEYKELFGVDFCSGRESVIYKLIEAEYIRKTNGRLALTEKGFYVSNSILTQLI